MFASKKASSKIVKGSSSLPSWQCSKKIADFFDDRLRFLRGGEVPATLVMSFLLEVVVAFSPTARGITEFLWQHRNTDRRLDHRYSVVHRSPRVVGSLVVVACRGSTTLRDPVNHDRREEIVLI